MSRFFLTLALAGLAGACTPVIGGYQYGTPDDDDDDDVCSTNCNDDDDDDTNDDDDDVDPPSGSGGDIVDQDGNRIAHVDDCGDIDWEDYRDGAESYLALGAPRYTGSFWPHGESIEDLSAEAPSDFIGWDLEGEFYSSTRVCGVVLRWDGDFEAIRASITGCPGSIDLGNEPFGHEPEGRDCSWTSTGGSDAQAELEVDAAAYLDGEWVNVTADYFCWGGPDAGCGAHAIAIRDDLADDFDEVLYRGH